MSGKPSIAQARAFQRRVVARYPTAQSTTTVDEIGTANERVSNHQVMFAEDTVETTLFLLSLGDGNPPDVSCGSHEQRHICGRTKGGLPFVVLIPEDVWPEVKAALAGEAMAKVFGGER